MKIYFSLLITILCTFSQTSAQKKKQDNSKSSRNSGKPASSGQPASSGSGILPPDYQPTDSPLSINQELARLYGRVSNRSDFIKFCDRLFENYYPQAPNTCVAFYDGYVPPAPTQQSVQSQQSAQASTDAFIATYSNLPPSAAQMEFMGSLNATKSSSSSEADFLLKCVPALSAINGIGLFDDEKGWYCRNYYNPVTDFESTYFYPVEIGDLAWANPHLFISTCSAKIYYTPKLCVTMWRAVGRV